jgi:lipopolysaccharide biosynthesis regulator YciM
MSQVELENFPTNKWTGIEEVYSLKTAEVTLRSALQYDPTNPNANYRLGMISMLRQDFESAVSYLETAHVQMPNHRGMTKTLGYAYAWSGDMERAQVFLAQIPEVEQELDVYTWWWGTQGRSDLAESASLALNYIKTAVPQP